MEDYNDLLSNEKYDVFKYIVKNPSLLVAILSALSAIILILLYSTTYLQDASLLDYWNIPKDLIDINSKTKIYKTGLTLLTALLFPTISKYFSSYFSKIKKSMEPLAIYNCFLSNSDKSNDSLKEEIEQTNLRKSDLIKDLKLSLTYLLLPLFFFIILYITLELYHLNFKSIITVVLVLPGIWLVMWLLIIAIFYHKCRSTFKKSISYDDVMNQQYPYEFGFIKKNVISNQSILIYLIMIVMITILFFSMLVFIGSFEATHPKQFEVVERNNDLKVIIYKTNGMAVLEPCEVNDKVLIVDVSQQELIPLSELSYKICQFENVERINHPSS